MPQHVQRSMLFNFYTGFGRFRRSAWSKKWYGSGRTSRIASDAPEFLDQFSQRSYIASFA